MRATAASRLALLLLLTGCVVGPSTSPGTGVDRPGRAPGPLLAGAARRVITPDLDSGHPVYMAGFSRGTLARSIHDDLWARALVLTDRTGTSIALVTLDLIGFFHDDVEAIRLDLEERYPGAAIDYLVVASTHNHAGPDVIGLWTPLGSSVDGDYIARIRREATDTVAEAWRSRTPARIHVGRSTAPDLAHDSRLPHVIDDTLLVMGLEEEGSGRGIATLVNWGSHPGVAGDDNTAISADFPHGVVRRLERDRGGVCLFTSGAMGGQIGSSRIRIREPGTGLEPDSRLRRAELLGDAIGAIASKALSEARRRGGAESPVIGIRRKTLFPALDNPRFALGLSMGLIRPRSLYLPGGEGRGWLPSDGTKPAGLVAGEYSIKTEVGLIDLGPARWALIPGELYPELALGAIQYPPDPGADYPAAPPEPALRRLSDKPLFLINLANDEIGYIIPKSQWDAEPPYAYGREEPQYGEENSLGPETAPLLMEALRGLFETDPGWPAAERAEAE